MISRFFVGIAVLMLACSPAFARDKNWVAAFNQTEKTLDVAGMERAEDVARKRWLSISGEAAMTAGVNSAQSLVPVQMELVWMNLRIAAEYLRRWNENPTSDNKEALDVPARRLYYVSKSLEPTPYPVRLLVAISRFDGKSWDIGYDIGIDPAPALKFDIYFGAADGVKIFDYGALYRERIKYREGGLMTGVICTATFFLACPSSFLTQDERELSGLGFPVYLDVHDANGKRIDLRRVEEIVRPELQKAFAESQGIHP